MRRCHFCAEEIQDQAILCRFCGAIKEGDTWKPPPARPYAAPPQFQPATPIATVLATATPVAYAPAPAPTKRGHLTIRISAALFFLSALIELFQLTSPVPLFGDVRRGAAAVIFHLIYVALFAGLGVGLWRATEWGYKLVFAGTAYYTLEKMIYLFDRKGREADLLAQVQGHRELLDMIGGPGSILQVATMTTLAFVACMWGFALYIYLRREYFEKT